MSANSTHTDYRAYAILPTWHGGLYICLVQNDDLMIIVRLAVKQLACFFSKKETGKGALKSWQRCAALPGDTAAYTKVVVGFSSSNI